MPLESQPARKVTNAAADIAQSARTSLVRAKAPATIRDVARIAQVSVTTVSHALSAKRPVSAETVARIQAAIEFTGYVPHSAAQKLQAGKAFMVGLVVPDVSHPFFGQLARGVEEYADEHGYGVIISSSGGRAPRSAKYFDLLRSRSIDGLIYVAGESNRDGQLAELARSYPIVLADEWTAALEGIPLVSADQRQGGRLVGQHLMDLGHTDVAAITGPRGLLTTEDRLAGFLELYPNAEVVDGNFSEEVAYHRTGRLLSRDKLPTAIFASNDDAAFGVIDSVKDRGMSVPGDISVVGYDDLPLARRFTPSLTTVRQPINEIGQSAAQLLIAILSGSELPDIQPRPVDLVIRESTGVPRA